MDGSQSVEPDTVSREMQKLKRKVNGFGELKWTTAGVDKAIYL